MTVHPEAAVGFGRAADAYERGRPGYPSEMVGWLCGRVGIGAGRRVLDLAAGTGKLTRALVATGASLMAADPLHVMLRTLRDVTGGVVPAVTATAQALPLADGTLDGIVVAQGFHWFDSDAALTEMLRVLAPGGAIGLVWNVRRPDDPLQAAISAIIDPHRRDTPSHASGRWRRVVDRSVLVDVTASHAVAHAVTTDVDGLVDRILSISFVSALPDAERMAVERRVREVGTTAGPTPVLRYRCEGYLLTPR
ncbi:MAG TPA: methyltransferase domain-containing protein [Euzebyales bacterium]|nr:methyltransferase domain-containing protein [Euzebyales bacterium]